jgi:uncharacterized protein (TIGR00299 family) protein
MINQLPVSQRVRDDAAGVYELLAQAEAHVHGVPAADIHFHEVGTLDAIADIVGVCLLMDTLAPREVIVSPVHVGSGAVRCAHGILPVPAPAAAYLLRGIPVYARNTLGELCTPTGAALLKYFGHRFGPMPEMVVEHIGYGMGKKDFEAANCLRAFWGAAYASESMTADGAPFRDEIVKLECNLDDMTGEALGRAVEVLFQNGAKDVFTAPVYMKKNRPGVVLTCICEVGEADRMAALMLAHTTTFGLRKTLCGRYILNREISAVETGSGSVRVKAGAGYGVTKSKAEYEDVAKIAEAQGISFMEAERRIQKIQAQTGD